MEDETERELCKSMQAGTEVSVFQFRGFDPGTLSDLLLKLMHNGRPILVQVYITVVIIMTHSDRYVRLEFNQGTLEYLEQY